MAKFVRLTGDNFVRNVASLLQVEVVQLKKFHRLLPTTILPHSNPIIGYKVVTRWLHKCAWNHKPTIDEIVMSRHADDFSAKNAMNTFLRHIVDEPEYLVTSIFNDKDRYDGNFILKQGGFFVDIDKHVGWAPHSPTHCAFLGFIVTPAEYLTTGISTTCNGALIAQSSVAYNTYIHALVSIAQVGATLAAQDATPVTHQVSAHLAGHD